MEKTKGLLKVEAVADRLGVSTPHAYRLARIGAIPCVRLGPKSIRFEPEAVEQFIREHSRKVG